MGGVIGWFIIGPVNAGLGWLFGIFNSVFDRITKWYGWTVSKNDASQPDRRLLVYLGLLALTWWGLGPYARRASFRSRTKATCWPAFSCLNRLRCNEPKRS